MQFKTQYDSHARVYHHPGSGVKDVYTPRYDEFGVLDLVVSGQEDLYGYIQSHYESTDIHVILERFAAGDVDVLSRHQGFYADMSDMPKTYAEVLNAVIAGENAFDHLPIEIKQKFGNSFAVWLSSMDSPEWSEKMGFDKPSDSSVEPVPAPSVVGPQSSSAPSAGSQPSSAPSPAPVSDSSVASGSPQG